jgi:hypothetical protein
MKSEPVLVHHIQPTPDDLCLGRLIEFFGLPCRAVDTVALDAELDRAPDHELCILANASCIDAWCQNFLDPTVALTKLRQKSSFLFIYGFAPESSPRIAAGLSDSAISGVKEFAGTNLSYQVTASKPEITREFSGLTFGGVHNSTDYAFACSANAHNIIPLVSIGGMTFWVLVEEALCKIFLLACNAIADIREQVNELDATRYFSRLLPAAMFLMTAFKSRCWHNKHRFANFIIDDPPLKRSYGYLNYRELVSAMDRCDFASTIAFIPWNHTRTENAVTQLFRERPDRLSLCVHGCDHTTGEFSTTDQGVLNSRVQLATARMNSLQSHTGIPYSKTMVFPQGRFSTEALTALKSNNYVAAVNSCGTPASPVASLKLTVGDFLGLAVTSYGGFPVFLRRYPGGLEQFAFDLFFGKPLLVVEHHAYMKDGGARLAEFIARLNSLENLEWTGLHDIVTKSYLERELSDDVVACTLYTNCHVIQNHAERERTFMVAKTESDEVPIREVLVNGRSARFTRNRNTLEFETRIPALSSAVVSIIYGNLLPRVEQGQGFARRSRIWTRRMLSEFRDNVLSRTGTLLAGAETLHRESVATPSPQPGNVRRTPRTTVTEQALKETGSDS